MTTKSQTDNTELGEFVAEMIAPFSIHRAKYARPHGTVARRQFANRMNKRLEAYIQAKIKEQDIKSRIDEVSDIPIALDERGLPLDQLLPMYKNDRLTKLRSKA